MWRWISHDTTGRGAGDGGAGVSSLLGAATIGRAWRCLGCHATLGVRFLGAPGHGDTLELRIAAEIVVRRPDRVTIVCVCGASRQWTGGRVVVPGESCSTLTRN